jgi:heme-degrading monooxygenase HmoA
MITRIVKMTFTPDGISDFLKVFEERRQFIADFDGCQSVNLLQDVDHPDIFFTYSKWDTVEHLNKYRESELFKNTWALVKVWFADKPEAWSVKDVE